MSRIDGEKLNWNEKRNKAWDIYCKLDSQGKGKIDQIIKEGFPCYCIEELCEALILKIEEAYDSSGHIDESLWQKFLDTIPLYKEYCEGIIANCKEERDEIVRMLKSGELDWVSACEYSPDEYDAYQVNYGYCIMFLDLIPSLTTEESRLDVVKKFLSRFSFSRGFREIFGMQEFNYLFC
ncbi:MAG: hypothetical protein PHZ25_02850 [Candidatus Pacebacteria bacterium]|nr:hypothetical protein [Candidatus Paceibacterota bacterium]